MKRAEFGPKEQEEIGETSQLEDMEENEEIKQSVAKSESSDQTDESEIISQTQNMSIPHLHRVDDDRM